MQSARARVPVEVFRESNESPKTLGLRAKARSALPLGFAERGLFNQEHFSFVQIYESRHEYCLDY